jgi:hypothetical protein
MRSLVVALPLLAFLVAAPARSEEGSSGQNGKPIQLSLFNPVQIFPDTDGISGFRLNIIYSKNAFMKGFDLGFIVNEVTGDVAGVEWGLVNLVSGSTAGWQAGAGNVNHGNFAGWQESFIVGITEKKFEGFQSAWIYNSGGDVTGLQLGLVNHAVTMNGLQLGLVNIIEKGGMLPVFVIFNASFR